MSNDFNFTHERIRKIIAPENGRTYYLDTHQGGLRLQVTSKGTKTFQFVQWDKIRKKPIKVTLGTFPTLSVKAARELSKEYASAVSKGLDVAAAKRKMINEPILNDAFDNFLNDYAKVHKKDWKKDKSRYELYIKTQLGGKKVRDISISDIRLLQRNLIKKPKIRGEGTLSKTTVNRVMALLKTVLNRAGRKADNPVKEIDFYSEEARNRKLETHEFQPLFEAMNSDNRQDIATVIKIALLTGARRSNVLQMKWSDLQLDRKIARLSRDLKGNDTIEYDLSPIWIIPSVDFKGKRVHEIALSDTVVEILKKIKKNTFSIYVFPAPLSKGSKPLTSIRKPWSRIKKSAGIEGLRFHDLRRSFGTFIATSANSQMIKQALGHKSITTSQKYIATNADSVRALVEATSKAMMELSEKKQIKIVDIDRKNV